MDKQLKHLEMIQAVISRMALNSFFIKGWSVTLVSALMALAVNNVNTWIFVLVLLPVILFWVLDAFFLHQERLFRALYDDIRDKTETEIDFSMDTNRFRSQVASWLVVGFSKTLLIFHGMLLTVVILAIIFFTCGMMST
jgi:hypothetical protein